MKKLKIYIPTYNRCESLKLCINRILLEVKGLESEIEVHISDNNSTDGTYEYLSSLNNEIISFSKNDQNIGGPLNILKFHDLEVTSEYSLIIGDDDYIIANALKKLIYYLNGNSNVDFFFINSISYSFDKKNEVLEALNYNGWNSMPEGGNIKSRIQEDFLCTLDELIDPQIDEVFAGSIMCYVFKSALVSNHLIGYINSNNFKMYSSSMYSSYPHTLNWIYSLEPKTPAAFIKMPVTVNFWHEGKDWGEQGYHRVVSEGLGFLLFELIRLNYIKKENQFKYFNHYLNISRQSILLLSQDVNKNGKSQLSENFLNYLVKYLLTLK